ncbi:MAG: fatty acid desaturase [Flavobacteriales bacterium]|nr:fatty acid desaturase [Flavobacteriales bacterium]
MLKTVPPITDPVFVRPDRYSLLDRFFLRFLRDERDLPFPYLMMKVAFLMVPLAILLYMPFVTGWLWAAIAVGYFYLNNVRLKGPFGLMMHCSTHRPLFKPEYEWMNRIIPWFLAPWFGQSPETYRAHHIGMHHAEGNMPEDGSSTMSYQRDKPGQFIKYYLLFLSTGVYEMLVYLARKGRRKLWMGALFGELLYFLFCAAMCLVDWKATLVVFILPLFIFRLIAMTGNWVQHTFIDPTDPGNDYKNSITCINVKFNKRCWNDGYHISHHIQPTLHWTEHPVFFQENLAEFGRNKAVIFNGLDYGAVFFLLMRDRYEKLAEHFVDVGDNFRTDEEVIAFLRSRTARMAYPAAAVVA